MPTTTGAKYLANALEAYGVSHVFLVPTVLSKTLYEMERTTEIARIVTHGEKAAAYMADGYARATGRPGICMAQNIGAANLAAGLRDAYLGCSPVIALTGGPYQHSRGRNYYQEIEDFPLFKPVTKFSEQVFELDRLPDLLRQAFRESTTGKPGPTHLELAGHTGDDVENQIVDWPDPTPDPITVPAVRMEPDQATIAVVVQRLSDARRPVIVAGGGVRASGAGAEVLALGERLGIPIATSLNAKDTVPGNHRLSIGTPGLYARASANQIVLEADLVFFIGSRTGSQLTLTWQVPSTDAQVIHLDIDPSEPGRHYPNTTPLIGDAKLGLTRLLAALGADHQDSTRAAWLARVTELGQRWREETSGHLLSDQVPMRPERLCTELTEHLPADALLVADTGHAGMWTGGYVDLTHDGQGFIRAAGSLGWGLPAAIGAQLADRTRPVVLFTGDGGLWYHVAELETAARWNVPLVVVVNNNRSLNQEINPYLVAYEGELHGKHAELWHFRDVDLAAMAETMGVSGLTVRKPAEFQSALDEAIEINGPVLINVETDITALAPKGKAERAA